MQIISPTTEGITVSKHGLEITRQLSFGEWREILHSAKSAKSAYLSILSDITSYGRKNFGDELVNEAIEQLEFELSDATKAEFIGRIGLEQRRLHNLSSEHAYVIGRLVDDSDKREEWAALCCEHNLTAFELKKSIERGKIVRQAEISDQSGHSEGIPSVQAVHFQFLKWQRQFGESDKILKLPVTEREKILTQLTPIIELAAAIESSLSRK